MYHASHVGVDATDWYKAAGYVDCPLASPEDQWPASWQTSDFGATMKAANDRPSLCRLPDHVLAMDNRAYPFLGSTGNPR